MGKKELPEGCICKGGGTCLICLITEKLKCFNPMDEASERQLIVQYYGSEGLRYWDRVKYENEDEQEPVKEKSITEQANDIDDS